MKYNPSAGKGNSGVSKVGENPLLTLQLAENYYGDKYHVFSFMKSKGRWNSESLRPTWSIE